MRSRFVELSQGRRPQLTVVGISGGGFRWLTITWKRSIWMGAAAVVTIWAAGRGQKVATAVWDLPVRSRAARTSFGSLGCSGPIGGRVGPEPACCTFSLGAL